MTCVFMKVGAIKIDFHLTFCMIVRLKGQFLYVAIFQMEDINCMTWPPTGDVSTRRIIALLVETTSIQVFIQFS